MRQQKKSTKKRDTRLAYLFFCGSPSWTRTNGPDFGRSPRPLWLRTLHCNVRLTRRALCAVLLAQNPAQARWFGYNYVVIKEKEHRLGTLFFNVFVVRNSCTAFL